MNDPLYADGVDLAVVIIVIVKALFVFAMLLVSVLIMIWAERKVVADMQNRVGPNRAGPFGVLQSLADGIKLFFKEQSIPAAADRPVFRLAPYLSVLPAFLAFSVIPLGGEFEVPFTDKRTILQLADLPIGVLFVLAMSGLGVYGVLLAGWSSGSKYPLLGSVRASAQMVSYEAALGLGIIGAVVQAGTLSTWEIIRTQGFPGTNPLDWFVLPAIGPFVIFCIAAVAETNRAPFDLVEAEQELVGGFHTEYTGIRFAMFFLAEYMNMVTQAGIAVTLFLGGPSGPGIPVLPAPVEGVLWFILKVSVFMFGYIWLRASLPRLRYDQLMDFGWKVLIPAGLLWLGVSSVFVIARQEGWPPLVYVPAAALGAALVYGVLYLSMPKRSEAPDAMEVFPERGTSREEATP
ncbi:MAG TPA: NADH-quinone oxidoreductase subunit NuoH [Acidimicrobiia bacterium]|nr:NADH-quinone oxidoreductase subunit NuoH [Acidimicrobiia bacterium]